MKAGRKSTGGGYVCPFTAKMILGLLDEWKRNGDA